MQFSQLNRREFVTLLGGAAAAWPRGARAQQDARMRHVGVLAPFAADDEEGQRRIAAFLKELQQFGWVEGRNIQIVYRWGAADAERIRTSKAELLGVADVILSQGSSITSALQQATGTVPVVFVNVADPVGAGFVDSLSRPGGNITGFILGRSENCDLGTQFPRPQAPGDGGRNIATTGAADQLDCT